MNDYDKTGRYLVKGAPPEFFHWLLATPSLVFHSWIDARRIPISNQKDLTKDLAGQRANRYRVEATVLLNCRF